ncbi:MAG TPA: hypothetical protein DEB60_11260 [Brevundimonas sp.]|uniref:hypothetical protein n=1 Tax=Brevundimonas sp. TaxID=1871086 RepID=UPI000E85BB28|nr:hypothetical protein [Brevundimonas sp.]MBN9464098.1 hypothetical protein [Brevundimonas sp.]HBV13684.1 hypothetical protein [Brevundimonas sp.]
MPSLRTSSRVVSIALAVQALSACATFRTADPPVCDGRHRRPANPYGSILSPAAHKPAPAADAYSTIDPGMGGCA